MRKALLNLLEINVNAPLTRERIITTLVVSMVLGILILFIYRITYRGVLFNRSFGTALLMVFAGHVTDHLADYLQHRAFSGYGRRPVHCSFPDGAERSNGYCLHVLGNRRRPDRRRRIF